MQTKLKTYEITPNAKIWFPIGTILAVKMLYDVLNFADIIGMHKKNGIGVSKLLKALGSYKLIDNFSIKNAHQWINHDEVLKISGLESFNERILYRVLTIIGSNGKGIISDIQDSLFDRYKFEHINTNMDWTNLVLHGVPYTLYALMTRIVTKIFQSLPKFFTIMLMQYIIPKGRIFI